MMTLVTTPDPRFERALGRARRHSRRVRWMRAGLPVAAAVGVVAFGALAWFSNALPDGFSIEGVRVEGGDLVMTEPRLRGFDERDQPYSVDAERATQNVADPDLFELTEVLADIPLPDGRRLTVSSAGGAYDRGADLLAIPEPFSVMVDDGTVGRFSNGTINIADGTMTSGGEVTIENDQARIRADAMTVERAGRNATFTGNVRVTIEPGSDMAPPTLRGAAATTPSGTAATTDGTER